MLLDFGLGSAKGGGLFGATGGATSAGNSLVQGGHALQAAAVGLGFGVLVIALVLAFIGADRRRTHQLEERLIESGDSLDERLSPSLEGGAPAPLRAPEAGVQSNTAPAITGPATLRVGRSAKYTYAELPGGSQVTWSVAGPATIPKGVTASTLTVTANGPGEVDLTAQVGSDQPQTRTITAVTASGGGAVHLSMLGEGYGTVVIALAVASVTVALGLTNVLNGEAVAGILGSLVTYSVVRGIGTPSGTGSTSGTTPSQTTGTTGTATQQT